MLILSELRKFEEPVYVVYKTTNLINEKFYIGYHKTHNLDDDYLGSGKLLWRSILKYGKNNFKREILFVFSTSEEAFEKEVEIIALHRGLNPLCMNFKPGGKGGAYGPVSKETRTKISAAGRIWIRSEETKARIRASNLGQKRSEETKNNISTAKKGCKGSKGHKVSEEGKARLRAARAKQIILPESYERGAAKLRGKARSEETKAKIRASNLGQTRSEETLAKMRGKKHSEETKAKISAAQVARLAKKLGEQK